MGAPIENFSTFADKKIVNRLGKHLMQIGFFAVALIVSVTARSQTPVKDFPCSDTRLIGQIKNLLQCERVPTLNSCSKLKEDNEKPMVHDWARTNEPSKGSHIANRAPAQTESNIDNGFLQKLKAAAARRKQEEENNDTVESYVNSGSSRARKYTTNLMAIAGRESLDSMYPDSWFLKLIDNAKGTMEARPIAVVAGPLGAWLASTSSTGCSELGDGIINIRSKNGACVEKYEPNMNVLEFVFRGSEQEQLKMLKTPKVCDFYKKLRDNLYAQPKFTGLTCSRQKITITGTSPEGKSMTTEIMLRDRKPGEESSTAKKIYLRENGAVSADMDISNDGVIRDADKAVDMQKPVRMMRLYAQDAINCCQTQDDAQAAKCMRNFIPEPGAQNSSGGRNQPTAQ